MYCAEIIAFYCVLKISRHNKTTLQLIIFLMTLFLFLVLLNKLCHMLQPLCITGKVRL